VPSDAPVDAEGKPLRFSTDFLPARDRLAIWREVIGRTVARLDLAPLGPGPFRSDTTSRILPDLSVTALSITAVRSQRTRELIADGNDDVLLIRINEGGGLLSHRGREIELGGGQGVIFSNAEVSSVSIPRLSHGLSLRLPRKVLVPLVPHLDDAIMSRIPAANEALQLLASYVAALDRMEGLASPDLREVVSRHLQDLVAAAIGATGENAEIIRQRGVGAARLQAIKLDIVRNIGHGGLSAEWIAARHGISAGYARRLFEAEETSFSEFLLATRLAHAHQLLRDKRLADRTVSSIAFSVGFGDLSYFNRTFRRRYGLSPSDIRAQAAERDDG
jgi:AraC-like DNA-binding protein